MVADFPKNLSVAEEYFGTLLITIFGMAKDCGARAHYRKTHENDWKCMEMWHQDITIHQFPSRKGLWFLRETRPNSQFQHVSSLFPQLILMGFSYAAYRFLCFHHRTPWSSLFWWWSSALGFSLAAVFFADSKGVNHPSTRTDVFLRQTPRNDRNYKD